MSVSNKEKEIALPVPNIAKRKPLSKAERKSVYRKYNGHCAYCGKKLEYKDMQVDHVQPVYFGGKNNFENLMPSCRSCNFYKSTYTLDKFREQLGLILGRLKRDSFIYRLALSYGMITENSDDIEFYFEKIDRENNKL